MEDDHGALVETTTGSHNSNQGEWYLYLSHFFSTWNARVFEFASVLFITSSYPGTLLPASTMQIATLLSSLALSAPLGSYLDANSRLSNLRLSILVQRVMVVFSCLIFYVMNSKSGITPIQKGVLFSIAVACSATQRLSGKANMITMERDWVPTLYGEDADNEPTVLARMNAAMRRIDLFCKLLAPVFTTFVTSLSSRLSRSSVNTPGIGDGLAKDLTPAGVRITVFVIGGMASISPLVEWRCAEWVYERSARLQAPKVSNVNTQLTPVSSSVRWTAAWKIWWVSDLCLPSIALALLYMSTLSFSISLTTYLLNTSFSLSTVTTARFCSSLLELSATVVMPFGVAHMSQAAQRKNERYTQLIVAQEPDINLGDIPLDSGGGVERTGLWGIWFEACNLIPATILLFILHSGPGGFISIIPSVIHTIGFFSFIALSRLGLWTFDLAVSQLMQTLVIASERSSVASVEMALCSLGEFLQFAATAVWSRTDDFRYVSTATTGAVVVAALAFTIWVRKRRGHLFHVEKVACGHGQRIVL